MQQTPDKPAKLWAAEGQSPSGGVPRASHARLPSSGWTHGQAPLFKALMLLTFIYISARCRQVIVEAPKRLCDMQLSQPAEHKAAIGC